MDMKSHAGHEGHSHGSGPADAHAHEHPAPAATAAALKDPVCGMTVTEQSPHRAEHEGRPYYFCSAKATLIKSSSRVSSALCLT